MKKVIRVVALDPFAGISYKKDMEGLFGGYTEIVSYSVLDGTATGKLPRADLFVISTNAYGTAEDIARLVPISIEVI